MLSEAIISIVFYLIHSCTKPICVQRETEKYVFMLTETDSLFVFMVNLTAYLC